MASVRCYECHKTYDYYEDGFCPRCGAFNQPPRQSRIDEFGNIVYNEHLMDSPYADGINEKNHSGSFVHKEYHRENWKRRFTALEQKGFSSVKKSAPRRKKSASADVPSKDVIKVALAIFVFFLYLINLF